MIAQRFTTTPSGLESAPVGATPARRLALIPAEEGSGRPGVRRYRLSRSGAAPTPTPARPSAIRKVPSAV